MEALLYSGFMSVIIPILLIGGIIYLVARARRNGNGITAFQVLIGYFYLATAASVIMMAVGCIILIEGALSDAFWDGETSESLISGLVLLGIGALLCIIHVYGMKALEKDGKASSAGVKRVYLFSMLLILGIAGLVSLPLAAIEAVQYYTEDSRYYYGDPSAALAAAIVFVPLWSYYLYRVLREVRGKVNDQHTEQG